MNAHDASELAFKNGYAAGFAAAEEHYQLEIKALQAANKGMYTASCEMDAQINKLTAERDALLTDVSDYQGSICCYCKHIVRDYEKRRVYCGHFGDFPTSDGMPLECGRFEWRGLSLETETSDKKEG